jgi:uncharacterized protein YeeX (DUF496 family)
MGLFDRRDDKKKSDAFDSPVETIDLNAPPPDPEPTVSEPAQDLGPTADYGIEQAIQLMRTLPQENVELVVQVVKHTLESTKIQLTRIIEDANQKQQDIQARITVLREEIADYEKEISTRKAEIETLEADHEETSTVKERLILAEKLGKGGGAAAKGSGSHPAQGKGSPGEAQRSKRPTEPPPPPGASKAAESATKK